ncbi:MAG: YIP1 family protein, partial [Promethearchaeota archaeon]
LGGQLIGLFIWSVVLWLVMAGFTRLHAEDRTLKRVSSMVGYAWTPLVLAATLNALYYFLFYHPPISDPSEPTMGLIEFMAYSMTFNLLPLILGFIFFLWSLVLLFLALSSLEIEGDRKIPIILGYFVVGGLIFGDSLLSVILGAFLSLFT